MIPTLQLQERDPYIIVSRLRALIESSNTGREQLTANRSYFLSPSGNDGNNGLTSGAAFLTFQHAYDVISGLDTKGFNVTVTVADGTYTGGILALKSWVGGGVVSFVGNTATPANVAWSPSSGANITFQGHTMSGAIAFRGMKLTPGSGSGAIVQLASGTIFFSQLDFAATTNVHLVANGTGAIIFADGAYAISGGALYHALTDIQGQITLNGTITLSSSLTFTILTVANNASVQFWGGPAIATSFTGQKYQVTSNATINTLGKGESFATGTIAGTADTEGVFL